MKIINFESKDGLLITADYYKVKPTEEGFHGSKILWESVKGFNMVWNALTNFLNENE